MNKTPMFTQKQIEELIDFSNSFMLLILLFIIANNIKNEDKIIDKAIYDIVNQTKQLFQDDGFNKIELFIIGHIGSHIKNILPKMKQSENIYEMLHNIASQLPPQQPITKEIIKKMFDDGQ